MFDMLSLKCNRFDSIELLKCCQTLSFSELHKIRLGIRALRKLFPSTASSGNHLMHSHLKAYICALGFISAEEKNCQTLDIKHSKLILLFILSPDLSLNCTTFRWVRWKLCRVKMFAVEMSKKTIWTCAAFDYHKPHSFSFELTRPMIN